MSIDLKNYYCDKCKSKDLYSEEIEEPYRPRLLGEENKIKFPNLKYYRCTCNKCGYFIEYRC